MTRRNQRSRARRWMFVWFVDCSISSGCSLSIDDVDDDDDGVGVVFGCSRCRRSQSSVRSVCGCYYDLLVERQSEKKRERERARAQKRENEERWKRKCGYMCVCAVISQKVREKERVRWASSPFSPSCRLQFIDESINILSPFSFCHSLHSLITFINGKRERPRIVTRERTNNTSFSSHSSMRSSHYF